MNKETKISILKAHWKGLLSKEDLQFLLSEKVDRRIFKSIIYPNGEILNLDPENHSMISLFEKAGIEFVHIKRRIIE